MNMNIAPNAAGGLVFLMMLAALVTAIFWMVVGWRAMIAHERMAEAAERLARELSHRNDPQV